jgi:transposase
MVFRKKDEHQAQFLSSNIIYDQLIDDDDVFEKILKSFDFGFIYDEVEHLYCADNGRPPYDPVRLFKASLVQRLKGLSDPEMEDDARYNIRIKHFIGIPIQDFGFDYSTLSRFRTRLGPELFERIFQKILTQIVDLGIIDPKRQYIDSLPVLAHAALPGVICLIYQAIENVVKKLDDDLKERVYEITSLTDEKLQHYSEARPLFKMDKANRKAAFEKGVIRAREIVCYLDPQYTSEELDLLKQILNENVDADNKKIQTEKPIKTLVDRDAKLGHKTEEDLIFGYKNHATVTDEGIITAVEVTSAAEKDDKQVDKIISKQEEVNLKPEVLEGDSAYGYIETFKTAKEKKVRLNAPFRGLDGELSVYELDYDRNTNTLTCPNNISVRGIGKDGLTFEFPIKTCLRCSMRDRCPLPQSKRTKLHRDHGIAREAIKRQRQRAEERKRAKENGTKSKSRLIIENVFAYLEKLGGKKTPYIGLKRTTIHVLLVSITSNIMKTIRLLEKKECRATPLSVS